MKLGEIRSCFRKCNQCNRIVANKKHNMCQRCYEKEEINRRTKKMHEVERYFIRNDDKNTNMKHPGYVDSIKNSKAVRMCCLNPNGFGPDAHEKT